MTLYARTRQNAPRLGLSGEGNVVDEKARTPGNRKAAVPWLASILYLCMSCGEEEPTAPPLPVATMVIVAPSAVALSALRDTTRLTATVLDQNGQVMTGALVAYSSSADSVATVDGSGLVTAVGNGTAVVTATSGEASGDCDGDGGAAGGGDAVRFGDARVRGHRAIGGRGAGCERFGPSSTGRSADSVGGGHDGAGDGGGQRDRRGDGHMRGVRRMRR